MKQTIPFLCLQSFRSTGILLPAVIWCGLQGQAVVWNSTIGLGDWDPAVLTGRLLSPVAHNNIPKDPRSQPRRLSGSAAGQQASHGTEVTGTGATANHHYSMYMNACH